MDVEKYLENQLADIDLSDLVREIITGLIEIDARKQIKVIVESEAKKIIESEIKRILYGQEITTDDGWGKVEKYPNFEAIFKFELKKRLDTTYEVKKIIRNIVEEKVKKLYEGSYVEITGRIVDDLVKSSK